MADLIYRQQAIDALRTCYDTETVTMDNGDEYINYNDAVGEIEKLPSIQPEQRWIPVTEESVIQAGYEGREVRFRIRGRLFAIRELAQ